MGSEKLRPWAETSGVWGVWLRAVSNRGLTIDRAVMSIHDSGLEDAIVL